MAGESPELFKSDAFLLLAFCECLACSAWLLVTELEYAHLEMFLQDLLSFQNLLLCIKCQSESRSSGCQQASVPTLSEPSGQARWSFTEPLAFTLVIFTVWTPTPSPAVNGTLYSLLSLCITSAGKGSVIWKEAHVSCGEKCYHAKAERSKTWTSSSLCLVASLHRKKYCFILTFQQQQKPMFLISLHVNISSYSPGKTPFNGEKSQQKHIKIQPNSKPRKRLQIYISKWWLWDS